MFPVFRILQCGQKTITGEFKKTRHCCLVKSLHSLLFCVLLRMLQARGVRRKTDCSNLLPCMHDKMQS